ncbi:hypothetical protein OSB04_023848 [Centaurea solstitialis]|uniref:ATP-dependent DNA helicase n=1 Tax=Centaurea solstitialis TaxID=347529 RepID=A0AA38SYE0_9ASTR|nr:hypothetical protein OSB04_023848 [Centaurea solstitialis]
MRRIANGEGSSQSTPAIRNIVEIQSAQVIYANTSERVPLGSHHQILNELSTEGTHENLHDVEPSNLVNSISSINYYDPSQVHVNLRKEKQRSYNREYWARNKERIKIRRRANGEGSSRSTQVEDVGDSTVINIVSSVDDDIDQYDFVYDNITTEQHVLPEQNACVHCAAKKFHYESDGFCCMKGNIKLAYSPIPEDLYDLFTSQSELGKVFRHNIRAYNTNFSFASMGVTLDNSTANMTSRVYTFRAHGGIYHKIDQLVPRDGHPRHLHLYYYDDQSELSLRLEWPNLDRSIVEILRRVLSTNPYAVTFRSLAELGPLDKYRVTLNTSVELDQRVYNRPTTSEVVGIWVEGNDNIAAYKRSIVVYGRSDYSQKIQPCFYRYDPMANPLFFPNGEAGWHSNILRHGVPISEIVNEEENTGNYEEGFLRRTNVSMREYYCYKFQIRPEENVLLFGGRLFQQFVVDTYIKLETARLEYLERNQVKIRADLYQGVVDCVNAGEVQARRIGQRVVLPTSFSGGPRDMRRRYLDAMTLVQDDEKPDMFLTVTCNPRWPEIVTELLPGQTAQDRPDLVARVFRAKLEDIKKQVFKSKILGIVKSYVYVVEFQKRVLLWRVSQNDVISDIPGNSVTTRPSQKTHTQCIVGGITTGKYIYEEVVTIDPDGDGGVINEIKRFQDARYISPPEAIWRIFSFRLSQIQPCVISMQIHLPNQQLVRFSENDVMADVVDRERQKRSMLTAFFHRNAIDMTTRNCLYKDFPKQYTWNSNSCQWNPRKRGTMQGRLVSVNPSEGEWFLSHITRPTSFEDLCTVNGLVHPSFRKAALERDYVRQYGNLQRVQDMVLTDIMVFLHSMGKDLNDFDLPTVNPNSNLQDVGSRKVQEEYSIIVEDEHLQAQGFLNSDQKSAFDEIMRHVDDDCPGMFFFDGPGETGKMFLYKALLAEVRSRGLIALATTTSDVAANNMPGGRTAHSLFKIPINLDNNSFCNIKQQSGTAQLIRDARLIIWDEASMAKRQALEALDRTMQNLIGSTFPFGGKIMVMGGDFRQVLPVVRRGTRAQIVDSSLRMSPLWSAIKKVRLTINMSSFTDPWFSEFLLRVGSGNEEMVADNLIRIPDDMAIPYSDERNSRDALINAVFPSSQINEAASDYIVSRENLFYVPAYPIPA